MTPLFIAITIDPDQPPLYEIPAPGYTPEVAKKVEEKGKVSSVIVRFIDCNMHFHRLLES